MTFWEKFWEKCKLDSTQVEVTLRMALLSGLSYALSVAYLPNLVPTTMPYMVGIVGSVLAGTVPMLIFSFGAVLPGLFLMMILALIWATMLIACFAVSDGLFTGIYAVFCLWMTSLHFGERKSSTSSNCAAFCALGGSMALSYQPLVEQFGLSIAGDLWTEQGLSNGLAGNRNILICLGWAIACFVLAIAVPPVRTARHTVSHDLLPAVLKMVHTFHSTPGDKKAQYGGLIHMRNALETNLPAKVTAFEPRLTKCHLTEDLVTPLATLSTKINDLAYLSCFRAEVEKETAEQQHAYKEIMDEALQVIDLSAKALTGQDTEHQLQNWKGTVDTTASLKDIEQDDTSVPEEEEILFGLSFHSHALAVREATIAWVDALKVPKPAPTWKGGLKFILKSVAPVVLLPLLSLQRLAIALTLPFRPSRWELKPILYGLKLAAGYTALACMTVYWDAYANFKITTKTGESGPVYNGWQLLGYAYAWRPTLEGTTKKGLQRVIGTALGGFSAWLGVILCAWSYDEEADINPYGLTAYLTVTTAFAGIYFTVDAGMMSRIGASYDHGYAGMYFTMTQALIALEIYSGVGTKSEFVANRIVATVTGVVMAILLSSIPPFVRGGDPKHISKFLEAVDESFLLLLKTFADQDSCKDIGTDDFRAKLQNDAKEKGQDAMYVLKDAGTLRILPIYRVSAKSKPLCEAIVATQTGITRHLYELMVQMIETKAPGLEAVQKGVQEFLRRMETDQDPNKMTESASHSLKESAILLLVERIHDALRANAAALKDIEFKPKFLMWY